MIGGIRNQYCFQAPGAVRGRTGEKQIPKRCKGRQAIILVSVFLCAFAILGQLTAAQPGSSGTKPTPPATPLDHGKAGELVNQYRSDLVLIEGKAGKGSGFVGEIKGRKFLVTNAHVLAAITEPRFRLLDNSVLKLDPAAAVALGHDLVIWSVAEGGTGIASMQAMASEVKIGDAVVVPGNVGGEGVINALQGEVTGIGPDRIEITAPIEPGSSGSPIIHVKSGKVIGVATYLKIKQRFDSVEDLDRNSETIRRFGYRLDSVRVWQPIDWKRFYAEAARMEKIKHTSEDLGVAVVAATFGLGKMSDSVHSPDVRTALENYQIAVKQQPAQKAQAARNLREWLRSASQSDIAAAKGSFTYDFFKRQFEEEEHARQEFADALGKTQ
jgi:hypothetical protein